MKLIKIVYLFCMTLFCLPAFSQQKEIPRPQMKLVPGGKFKMGNVMGDKDVSDTIVLDVSVDSFYIGVYEVTFTEYDLFCEAIGRDKPYDNDQGRGQRPAIHVSWCDAINYCNWLIIRHGYQIVYKQKGNNVVMDSLANGYRLPTEKEWEYAARERGKKIRYGNGKNKANHRQFNFYASLHEYFDRYRKPLANPRIVGSSSLPNKLGLYDMSGNVAEYCWDVYCEYVEGQFLKKDYFFSDTYERRTKRGGGWRSDEFECRSYFRSSMNPSVDDYKTGFRMARNYTRLPKDLSIFHAQIFVDQVDSSRITFESINCCSRFEDDRPLNKKFYVSLQKKTGVYLCEIIS